MSKVEVTKRIVKAENEYRKVLRLLKLARKNHNLLDHMADAVVESTTAVSTLLVYKREQPKGKK